jgi:hypothetical protein
VADAHHFETFLNTAVIILQPPDGKLAIPNPGVLLAQRKRFFTKQEIPDGNGFKRNPLFHHVTFQQKSPDGFMGSKNISVVRITGPKPLKSRNRKEDVTERARMNDENGFGH